MFEFLKNWSYHLKLKDDLGNGTRLRLGSDVNQLHENNEEEIR